MKIGFVSLGCPKNLVDSEVMVGLAARAGHDVTADPAEAEVLVVNTCAFIDRAKQESVDALLEMAALKKTGACRRLVVAGCLAERYGEALRAEIPEIDALVGTGEVPEIAQAIAGAPAPSRVIPLALVAGSPVPEPRRCCSSARSSQRPQASHSQCAWGPTPRRCCSSAALVATAAGAPHLSVRRRHAARAGDAAPLRVRQDCRGLRLRVQLLHHPDAAGTLPEPGARVGGGRGPRARRIGRARADPRLAGHDVLRRRPRRARRPRAAAAAADRVDGLGWIRLLYLYPTTITDETLEAMAECDKVCKYVDLPLQHASDRILKAMKRPGTRKTYDRLLANIRARVPGVTLRTTFIVGFPGETADDVEELRRFVSDTAFDHVGVFTYSHEEGTPAHALADAVPAREKARRRDRVMSLQKRMAARAARARVGSRARVLVDGPSPDHELVLQGRLAGQAPEIDPVVYLTDCDPSALPPGTFVEVEIAGAKGYDLIARPTNQSRRHAW